MKDEKIIELVRSGRNDKALAVLYKHFPMMQKMIRSNGGNVQDAEDIFQEALIVACRKIRETDFKLTAQLSTYLFSICRFLWKDELKKRKGHPVHDLETGLEGAEEQDLGDLVDAESRAMLAEKALNELSGRCRELLMLFYHGGMKLKDIAAKMGYNSENTAKNQKYKCLEGAKNRLRELKQAIQTL
jgi:RNA polymerase sigma factor (sigma-70 family)